MQLITLDLSQSLREGVGSGVEGRGGVMVDVSCGAGGANETWDGEGGGGREGRVRFSRMVYGKTL